MKYLYVYVLCLLLCVGAYAQTSVSGIVKDAVSRASLPFCSVAVKHGRQGGLTNADGEFALTVNLSKDTVVFSYLGYNAVEVPARALAAGKQVFLKRKDVMLQEFTVHSGDDYLYDILEKCRREMKKNRGIQTARVYYGLETQGGDQPVEQLECYYNGTLDGISVKSLMLKNGRIALAPKDNRYFLTLHTSKALLSMDLLLENAYSPSTPLQMPRRKLTKTFGVKLIYTDADVWNIAFYPRSDSGQCFAGELWIDKKTSALLKSDLYIKNATLYPFVPLFPDDSLSDVSIQLSETFQAEGNDIRPDHLSFKYSFNYTSVRDSTVTRHRTSRLKRKISTSGIMYFYEYNNPFVLPYFKYNQDFNDYRKLSIIPYNEDFWDNNNAMVLTAGQKNNLGFFAGSGQLVNFSKGHYGKNFLNSVNMDGPFFEYYYSFWSRDNRIILNRKMDQNLTWTLEKISKSIPADLYRLKVQILLDVNQVKGQWKSRSYTVFDAENTFYHLPEQANTKAFINIYFDIWETERQKMEQTLNSRTFSLQQIDSLYKSTVLEAETVSNRYLKEVQSGKDEKQLKRWNDFIREKLGIDNIKLLTTAPEKGYGKSVDP